MKVLKWLDDNLERVFLMVIMILATLIVALQVVTRYLLKVSLPWSEEIARYMFLWLTWVGASYATKMRRHVTIDIVVEALPKAGKKVCTVISTVVWIIFLCIMIYISVKLTASVASGNQHAVGSGIPMWIPYASIPTGMILMLFRLLQNCWHDLKYGAPKDAEEGGVPQ